MSRDDLPLTSAQVRGARAMIGMTQEELSVRANVPRSALAAFEADERNTRRSTIDKLQEALEEAGARFIRTPNEVGVSIGVDE